MVWVGHGVREEYIQYMLSIYVVIQVMMSDASPGGDDVALQPQEKNFKFLPPSR